MAGRGVLWAVLMAMPALAGCGTLVNLGQQGAIYGGVRSEAVLLSVLPDMAEAAKEGISPGRVLSSKTFLVADMSLSAVGDTLTLPYTLFAGGWGKIPSVQEAAMKRQEFRNELSQVAPQDPLVSRSPATTGEPTPPPAGAQGARPGGNP
jgi:uncharacterized protein YceK